MKFLFTLFEHVLCAPVKNPVRVVDVAPKSTPKSVREFLKHELFGKHSEPRIVWEIKSYLIEKYGREFRNISIPEKYITIYQVRVAYYMDVPPGELDSEDMHRTVDTMSKILTQAVEDTLNVFVRRETPFDFSI